MSYGTKYNLTFQDRFGNTWEVDIQINGYSGDATDLIGSGQPVKINYDVTEHWTHKAIRASSLELELIETSNDQYAEFFTRNKYAKAKIYKNSALYWQGWSIADNYRSLYNLAPKKVLITFVDGLVFLKSKELNLYSGDFSSPGIYQLKSYLSQAFTEIGLSTQIYESLEIYGGGDEYL